MTIPNLGKALIGVVLVWAAGADALEQLSDDQIAALIVKASRDAYYATGHPCACPDDSMRNGRRCGRVSAYIRPGGAAPLCYITDVPKSAIEAYRAKMKMQ